MWLTKLRGFRGVVQSGDETIGETTAGKNVFEKQLTKSPRRSIAF